MDVSIKEEAEKMVHRLTNGALEDIAALYEFPVAVYFGDTVIVLNNKYEFCGALSAYRSILVKAGLRDIRTRVVNLPKTEATRFKVEVHNTYHGTRGQDVGAAKIRYFVKRANGCAKINLVEYSEWPCPDEVASCDALNGVFPKAGSMHVAHECFPLRVVSPS